ncbi:hypothetical protein R5R35_011919 [Gryllus longicercus]|uniref:F-box domain-containing protein n=1 Tax=Gryllus longicercus TaxID=2509291 RepID=A0AAN9W2B9_9ORTH
MMKAAWKVDNNEEAIYIDGEGDEKDGEGNHVYSYWHILPDLILEEVFSYLSIRERYYASMVCRSWHRAFFLQKVWSTFTMEDNTLTRRKFNYYYGWQHVLDHLRTQMCLITVGRSIRCLVFEPMMNFYNLYEFMNMLSFFAERRDTERLIVGPKIRALKFTFPCNMADQEEHARIYGTGGRLLEALKRLMGNLKSLRSLQLIDLMLEPVEAQHLLDEVCSLCCLTLETLVVINTTKLPYQLLHVGVFLNLQVLYISPQNLGEDLLQLLGNTTLRHLHIVQNRYTPAEVGLLRSLSARAWRQCRNSNPYLCVHFSMDGVRNRDVVWQDKAPVRSIVYDSPHVKVATQSILTTVDLYRGDLWVYAHKSLPRFHQPKAFQERVDSLLLLLCRQCPYLHTLMVRERISTSTVLLLAHTARNLRYFYVRRNAVILRCDWPWSPEWSKDFYLWLKAASRSYESTEKEVSQIFRRSWSMLSDEQYKMTDINLHESVY